MASKKIKLPKVLDDRFEEAVAIVIDAGKASTSYLQRKLRVGYSRAATILDLLEEYKVVGKQDGIKPRKVLMKKIPVFERVETKEKARDRHKNELGRSTKAVKEAVVELENPTKEGLTPQEERFCQIYISPTEFYGNGTQSYIEAFNVQVIRAHNVKCDVEGNKLDDSMKQMTYNQVKDAAYRLLTRTDILGRVNDLLEDDGFNDEFVDKQLKHLITQSADPRVKISAITEYNKLKARIIQREAHMHSFATDDMSDEELMAVIQQQHKFFTKQ